MHFTLQFIIEILFPLPTIPVFLVPLIIKFSNVMSSELIFKTGCSDKVKLMSALSKSFVL